MAVSIVSQDFCSMSKRMIHDSSVSNSIVNNVTLSSGTLYNLEIDNTGAGTPTAVYFKIWDNTNPTLGTTEPDYYWKIPANVKRNINLDGLVLSNGFSYACVKGSAVDNTVAPDTTVQIYAIIS
jgi:hypothetical protein